MKLEVSTEINFRGAAINICHELFIDPNINNQDAYALVEKELRSFAKKVIENEKRTQIQS